MPAVVDLDDELLAELSGVTPEQFARVPENVRDALREFLTS